MLAEVFSEWAIILIIVVVVAVFGTSQLPKLARSLGSLLSEFKKRDRQKETGMPVRKQPTSRTRPPARSR